MKKGGLLLGYARVSKADDQDNAAQVKALRLAGCKRVFEEKGLVAGGTDRNCTTPWSSSGKGMYWLSGNSTDFPDL
jgi:hypothetical protein